MGKLWWENTVSLRSGLWVVVIMEVNRCVLEVLKYLEVKDILSKTSSVSQQWQRLSNSTEIWHFFCESEAITVHEISAWTNEPKIAYKELRSVPIYSTVMATHGDLKLFDCRSRQYVLTAMVKISAACSAIMIKNDRVFFTGGEDTDQRAFLYDFTKSQMEQYPNTRDCRRNHGSAYFRGRVYLFGGDCAKCQTAEMCVLCRKAWIWLSPLPVKRSAFTQPLYLLMWGKRTCDSRVSHRWRGVWGAAVHIVY